MTRRPDVKEQGFVLALVLVLSVIFLAIGVSVASLVAARYQSSKRNIYVENAILVADAGITDTLNQLTTQTDFTGYTTKKQLYSDTTKGKADYTTVVTYDTVTKLYKITSKGYAYRTPTDTTPVNSKSVEVLASQAGSSVSARAAVGPGGLSISGHGTLGGKNIWVNGKVLMNGNGFGAYIGMTGFAIFGPFADVSLNVANNGCGDATNYPIKCTGALPGAGEPIQVTGSGYNSIFGTVCATDQTTATSIFPGTSGLGLVPGCVAPAVTMPTFDRQALYNSMTQTLPGVACNTYYPAPGPHNIESNTIYNGAFYLGLYFGVCDNLIKGNAYIRGDLTLTEGASMTVAENDSNGNPITTSPIIAVEGKINMDSNYNITANSRGIGPTFISFNSNNATCNSNPACTTLSTSDLFNSVNTTTILLNGAFGGMSAATSTFYSYFGTVDNQTASVGALAGQRVMIESSGSNALFNLGGLYKDSFPGGDAFNGKVKTASWNIVNYRQIYP